MPHKMPEVFFRQKMFSTTHLDPTATFSATSDSDNEIPTSYPPQILYPTPSVTIEEPEPQTRTLRSPSFLL